MLSPQELLNWFANSETWQGRYGLWNLIWEHAQLTFVSLICAFLIAAPLGLAIGHFRKGEVFVVGISSVARALPTMGVLFATVLLLGVEFRDFAVYFSLVVIAVPAILAGTYSGVRSVPTATVDGAKAQGMTEPQIIRHVEFPLALYSIFGGLRIAFVQVVSTVTLAPLVGLGGLGFGIIQGLALRDFAQMAGSALLIVSLTLLGDRLLAFAQKQRVFLNS